MRLFRIVINPPGFDDFFCVLKIEEPMLVEAFIPHRSVEALHESILNWLTWLNELVLDHDTRRPSDPVLC
jgi:hypothetical protein